MKNNVVVPAAIFDTIDNLDEQQLTLSNAATKHVFAQSDFDIAKRFLSSYKGSPDTFNTYRREIERYLQWAWLIQNKSINQIKRNDFEAYLEFCQQPPASWIGERHVPRFQLVDGKREPNKAWRPFILTDAKRKYQLSQAGWKSIFGVLSSFYQYIIEEEYTELNPVTQIRQKTRYIRANQTKAPIRRLSELQWDYVIQSAEQMAARDPQQERTLFVMSCLYAMYLRISELVASERWIPQMNHFYQDLDGNWWFKTVGKGNKERDITVSDDMLNALKRYRLSLDLSALPSPRESTPLILKTNGAGPIESTRHVRRIVTDCFVKAVERMKADNFTDEAEQLKAATVHWLRHTGISEDVKTRPREHVRDDAGHSSGAITDRYIDVGMQQRHASAKKKKIKV